MITSLDFNKLVKMPKKLILSITERIEDAKPSKMVEELNFKIHRKAQEIDQEIIESTYAGLIEENKQLKKANEQLYKASQKMFYEVMFLAGLCLLQSVLYFFLYK